MNYETRLYVTLGGIILVIALALLAVSGVFASDGQPSHVIAWEFQGLLCVSDYDAGGNPTTNCYCPCEPTCQVDTRTVQEVIEDGPLDVPTPTPEPADEKCNAGRGNDSEGDPDCDPGNSGGKNQGGD